ncbi:MAG: response regulator [Gammaproteobacteria bacterium]|nr:MAG: response regulator [Gammaproteobacteria bacterium]
MALVLVVDDSPTEQHIFCKALERHGYDTVVASDGEEAIATALQMRPDVIVMDVVMPGMNGFQATRRLSKNSVTANIPVVIVSTKGQETDRIWGLRQGAAQYLVKPVEAGELAAAVEAAMADE